MPEFTLNPERRSFTADMSIFSISPISTIGLPSENPAMAAALPDLVDIINSARFSVTVENMAAKAAKDVRNPAVQGFSRNVAVHLSWECEFEHVMDSTDQNPLIREMLAIVPSGISLLENGNLQEKYRGFVYIAAYRAGGDGDTHQISYEGYAFFSRVKWHGEEGAMNIQATLTGFGPLRIFKR